MDEITMAIQVVDTAMIKLLLIFPAKPRSLITWTKFSRVNSFGRKRVGFAVSSPEDFTEHSKTHTKGKKAIKDKRIRYT